jgi:hypothetical protein
MKKDKDYLFIIYFSVTIDKKRFYKSLINTDSKSKSKEIFLKKIKKDLKGFLIKNIRIETIKKSKYRGRKITDKQWERLLGLSYPNTRHKLSKIPKNQWFKPKKHKRRNFNGTFKKGFVPWNKGLKLKVFKKDENGRFISSRDTLGRFTKGIQVATIGAKFTINDEKLKTINE